MTPDRGIGRPVRPERYFSIGRVPMPRSFEVQVGGAPRFLRGLRAAFVSDVHLTRGTKDGRLDGILQAVYALGADILLLGGDLGEGTEQSLRFLKRIDPARFPLGIFAVRGNNDAGLSECPGVRVLVNAWAEVPYRGGTLRIGGLDEHRRGRPDPAKVFPRERKPSKGCYQLLLSHFPRLPDCSADLMLSGHTHGGQMNLLGLTPYCIGFERRYRLCALRGMHRFGGLRVYVSRGIGTSRIPLRFGVLPEITLLKF